MMFVGLLLLLSAQLAIVASHECLKADHDFTGKETGWPDQATSADDCMKKCVGKCKAFSYAEMFPNVGMCRLFAAGFKWKKAKGVVAAPVLCPPKANADPYRSTGKCLMNDTGLTGTEIEVITKKDFTWKDCSMKCAKTKACNMYSFRKFMKFGICRLYSGYPVKTSEMGVVAGAKWCGTGAMDVKEREYSCLNRPVECRLRVKCVCNNKKELITVGEVAWTSFGRYISEKNYPKGCPWYKLPGKRCGNLNACADQEEWCAEEAVKDNGKCRDYSVTRKNPSTGEYEEAICCKSCRPQWSPCDGNGGCQHRCARDPIVRYKSTCSCYDGFVKDSKNPKKCIHVCSLPTKGGCEQICNPNIRGFCQCKDGWIKSPKNDKKCVLDTNPCEKKGKKYPDGCAHKCVNEPQPGGGAKAKCVCPTGFQPSPRSGCYAASKDKLCKIAGCSANQHCVYDFGNDLKWWSPWVNSERYSTRVKCASSPWEDEKAESMDKRKDDFVPEMTEETQA